MMSFHSVFLRASLLVLMLASSASFAWSAETEPKRIVLIAGKKSHGPEGNGIHDYPWSVKLLKVMLDNSNIAEQVEVEYHLNGWPADPQVLRRADTIMVISDGRDGDLYEEAPHFQNERNAALVEQQINRGCGFLTFHFSTFAPDKYAQQILDWSGGYFDWEENGQRKWYSAIRVLEADVQLASPEHPIARGVQPFRLREEFYYNIRFNPQDSAFTPILEVPALEGRKPDGNVVAWARERANGGRGFGTTCGHFYEHWKHPQFRKLVLNAIAWSAHVEVPQQGVEAEYYAHDEITAALAGVSGTERAVAPRSAASADQPPQAALPEVEEQGDAAKPERPAQGRFGQALAQPGGAFAAPRNEYRRPPITVECWAKLDSRDDFNILIANETKDSQSHWELFTRPNSGWLTVYMPGMRPDHVNTEVDICDGQWHYLAMLYEPRRVRLFVDGKQVADQQVEFQGGTAITSQLAVASLVERTLGCAGIIDEVRISRGVRPIQGVPDKPFTADNKTLGLWHFDKLEAGDRYADSSSLKNPMLLAHAAQQASAKDHFGEEVLGFRWSETASVDNRWNEMEVGRFLASTIPVMDQPPVTKGLSIRLGDHREANVCYDTERLALRAAWTGKFLNFTPARFGLISSPQIAGDLALVSKQVPGWHDPVRFTGHYQHGDRIVLAYQVGNCQVLETPWIETHAQQLAFTRTLEFSPTTAELTMHVGQFDGQGRAANVNGVELVTIEKDGHTIACALAGRSGTKLTATASGDVTLSLPAHQANQSVKLLLWSGPTSDLPQFAALVQSSSAPPALASLTQPGAPQWTEEIITQGVLGENPGPYAIDTLTLPFENPYRALMFVSGHDFFSNGDMAVCTVHGDVWRVSGVDDSLKQLTWKRYATGLFQPLGLKVVDDQVYVLGRDQITRLHDKNEDGEADFYENFNNLYTTSPGGHDYVACLETDAEGNFYLIHALQGVVRISPDGGQLDIVGTGLRNPNGLSVGPSGMITAAPQEGTWTPASCIVHVEQGGYYGFGGPQTPTPERPLGYDLPLCWIPRLQDNSSGGQAWVTSDRWGLPRGSLLHLSYGKCRMMLVLHERVGKQSQGGVIDFPLDFESGVMRGTFSPHDGQLYVSGLKGWTTAAVQDGCLQRVRYRGEPVDMPLSIRSLKNGLAITFARELKREAAEDTGNYHLQQWNYKYASSYGSAEYRVSDPRQEGRDEVNVTSATLLDDRRTVFLEIPELQPVNQMAIGYTLTATDGASLRQAISYTIHALQDEQMDSSLLARHESSGELSAEEEAALQPGLIQHFTQGPQSDTRNARLAALHVPAGTPPTPFLEAAPFGMTSTGYIRVPLKGEYTFQLQGQGTAALTINGREILNGTGNLAAIQPVTVSLHRGYNRLELRYTSPSQGAATVRLHWSSDTFALEPVPAHVLACDSRHEQFVHGAELRLGRELVATHKCFQCHAPPANVTREQFQMPELHDGAPQLIDAGSRFQHDWLTHWLLAPQSLRDQTKMPQLFDAENEEDRQQVADLAAYLTSLSGHSLESSSANLQDEKLVAEGQVLYEDLSCISCHRTTAPQEEDEFDRLSLAFVGAKYKPGALVDFLRRPHAYHANRRMPDFQLSEAEATALAAFLRSESVEDVAEMKLPPGSPERGQALFRTSGCINCHSVGSESSDLGRLARSIHGHADAAGCLHREKEPSPNTPKYAFTNDEIAALQKFLETDGRSLTRVVAPEASQRLVRTYNCQACHSRDTEQSPRAMIITEEGSRGLPPEMLPNLTFAGEKLQTAWMEKLLRGELDAHSRPWLTARMPAFPAHAEVLAAGLAAEHGYSPAPSTPLSIKPQRVEIGHRLTLKEGLDCRQCHAIGLDLPQGDENTQIAPGINFAQIRERLRPDFYHRFVLDPPRYDINSKMPKLAADGVTTKVHNIYDGDAARQFEALWHYIQTIEPDTTTKR